MGVVADSIDSQGSRATPCHDFVTRAQKDTARLCAVFTLVTDRTFDSDFDARHG